ncbi:MAG: hypothetical protein SVV03_05995 [Candidatus Nanohaloarchaea archaeon]|nr:hypothetical protein [Candidatus Nanohaloarchaea archaeon]
MSGLRPQVTIKTSQPFQRDIIQEHFKEEEMQEIMDYRDQLIEQLTRNLEALDEMERISGLEFMDITLDVWVFQGRDSAVPSPLMVPMRGSLQASLMELMYLIAKELIYENKMELEDHPMLEAGEEKLDVIAGMLAYRALEETETQRNIEETLKKKPFSNQDKTWDLVREKVGEWKEKDQSLLEFLGIEKIEREE